MRLREAQISGRSYMMERDDFKAENLTLSMRNRELETKWQSWKRRQMR
jgi:hypothetical protein